MTMLRIAGVVDDSIVDGPGLRTAVFVQGCPLACVGCHNPHTWDAAGGEAVAVADLVERVLANPLATGVTLSGGEPSAQAAGCAALARAAREAGRDVWCWSGYRVERLLERARVDADLAALLASVDVLVDGPFVQARRTLTLECRGSTNQRLIDVPATLAAGRAIPWSPRVHFYGALSTP